MNVREFNVEADYPMLAAWWKAHGWPALPAAILPKLGIVVEHCGAPVCAGFLYMDNSTGVSFLEWLTTPPDAPVKLVPTGIRVLCDFMEERARAMNYGIMLTTCRQPALARIYEKNGFAKTDEAVIHLVKVIELNPPEN
jgi:hypothetical protein